MTMAGGFKTDATGRATGSRKINRQMKIEVQFFPMPYEVLESPAYRVLSLSARKVLSRIECEHGRHGGAENGALPVTFADFVAYGIERHSVAPALAECQALGFLEITAKGRAGNGDFRTPNKFRLTYTPGAGTRATNEWKRIETTEQAKAAVLDARKKKPIRKSSIERKIDARSSRVQVVIGALARSLNGELRAPVPGDIESGGDTPPKAPPHSGGDLPPMKPVVGGDTPLVWGKSPTGFPTSSDELRDTNKRYYRRMGGFSR